MGVFDVVRLPLSWWFKWRQHVLEIGWSHFLFLTAFCKSYWPSNFCTCWLTTGVVELVISNQSQCEPTLLNHSRENYISDDRREGSKSIGTLPSYWLLHCNRQYFSSVNTSYRPDVRKKANLAICSWEFKKWMTCFLLSVIWTCRY